MKLNIQHRLTLVNVLPQKGNFETMSILENLKTLLYPSEAEVKKFAIKQSENRIEWNAKGTEEIEIPITSTQKEIIMKELQKLSEANELESNQYLVYKKFKSEVE